MRIRQVSFIVLIYMAMPQRRRAALQGGPSIVEPRPGERTVTRECHAAWTSVEARIQLTVAGERGD
jgi:hypothetical protein